jgi:perosamine synthetase
MCLKALGIGPGDEVITSPFSFIASSNAIVWVGAKPVFVDIDRDTYNIDAISAIWQSKFTNSLKAYLPVDVFGNPVDTKFITGIHKEFVSEYTRIPIILDSCESLGSKMERKFDCAVYAFYPNKQLTTGEGGCIVTDNKDIDTFCRAFRNQGRSPGDAWLESSMIGYNFRMTDIQAAIGIVQLRHFEEILTKRKSAELQYLKRIASIVKTQRIINTADYFNPFVFTVEVDNRTKVMQYLSDNGIETRAYFPCIHLQKPYRDMGYKEGDFPVAEEVASRTLALPFWSDISESEVDYVCDCLKDALKK